VGDFVWQLPGSSQELCLILRATGGRGFAEQARPARDLHAIRSTAMPVPLLILLVLIAAFGVQVGWLCRC
jgi:hypothetical protein